MALALLGQLLLALGVPLPAPVAKNAGQAFPCQGRPCGCLDADECWKGDCCCFTLEQKLAWAESNGVEPPAHVRPLLEKRKAEAAPPCPECEKHRLAQATPPRWVVGAFAQKCRGDGPAGLLHSEPAVPPVLSTPTPLPEPGDLLADEPRSGVSHRSAPPAPPPRA